MTISQAVALLHSSNGAGADTEQREIFPEVSDHLATIGPLADSRAALVRALTALDGTAADQIVEEALAITNIENVCLDIMEGALSEIGHRWEHADLSVGVEHFASAFVQRKFAALFNQSNPHEGRGPIVAACAETELHELGLMLTSLFLSRRGYRIVYLGANMPLHDLVETVKRVQPALVLLSAAREDTARRVAEAVPVLRQHSTDDAKRHGLPAIGYGGHAFTGRPDLQQSVDGAYLGANARDAVRNVDRIFAGLSV